MLSVQPPPGALSLTETLKFIVLLTEASTSQVGLLPAKTSGRFGKYRVGLVIGELDLKLGPTVEVDEGG